MGLAAEWVLTRTVVSVRSSSWCLAAMIDPPIKVIIGVLRELAGLLPLVFIHVETTGAWQANDVVCKRGGVWLEERSEESALKVVFLLHNKMDSFSVPKKVISRFYSPQSISSDSSAQSALLSHTRWDSMQWPLRHTKSVTAGQLTGSTASETHTSTQKDQREKQLSDIFF